MWSSAEISAAYERVRAEAGPDVTVVVATKYVDATEMAALAEAGIEVVGENRAQDLESEAWALRAQVSLALHRPSPVPESAARVGAVRAVPLARLALGGA